MKRDLELRPGVVYTPEAIARSLTTWAIRDANDSALDPCVGKGVFVDAIRSRLGLLGSDRPSSIVFGIDVEASARAAFRKLGGLDRNFKCVDFFSLRRGQFPAQFSAVVANPPYLRHHDIGARAIKRAKRAIAGAGFDLPGTANYWAYFVLHALQFLKAEGRLAFVLPGSVLHSDFASHVRDVLYPSFETLDFVALRECVFEGVQEEAVLLLADGKRTRRESPAKVAVRSQSVKSISLVSEQTDARRTATVAEWSQLSLTDSEIAAYEVLGKSAIALGDLFNIRIGVVTGANAFFVRAKSDFDCLPKHCWTMAVAKTRALEGLFFDESDWQQYADADYPAYLATLKRRDLRSARVRNFIQHGASRRVNRTSHARRRQPWYQVSVSKVPDAFLTCMTAISPAIVVNHAKAIPTNTLFALYARRSVSPSVTALAFATSLSQLGAELEGRPYGGGLLKVEPSDARQLPIPQLQKPLSTDAYKFADELRRDRKFEELAMFADCQFFGAEAEPFLAQVRGALQRLRGWRIARAASRRTTNATVSALSSEAVNDRIAARVAVK
jgi:hypothetical protein